MKCFNSYIFFVPLPFFTTGNKNCYYTLFINLIEINVLLYCISERIVDRVG